MSQLSPATEQTITLRRDATVANIDTGVAQKYLSFHISGCLYGIKIEKIKEVIEYSIVTHIPMTPTHIRGVINLRGNVVPVVDLAERLRVSAKRTSRRTCIIIIEGNGVDAMDLGLVVDAVDQVIDLGHEQIEPAPPFGTKIRADFIAGMGRVQGSFAILLDLDKVLSTQELSQLVLQASKNAYK